MQTCVDYAEKIKAKAKYCRYCGRITGYGLRFYRNKKAIEQKKDEENMPLEARLFRSFFFNLDIVFYIIVFILMLLFTFL